MIRKDPFDFFPLPFLCFSFLLSFHIFLFSFLFRHFCVCAFFLPIFVAFRDVVAIDLRATNLNLVGTAPSYLCPNQKASLLIKAAATGFGTWRGTLRLPRQHARHVDECLFLFFSLFFVGSFFYGSPPTRPRRERPEEHRCGRYLNRRFFFISDGSSSV